jgi:hypothetical protein
MATDIRDRIKGYEDRLREHEAKATYKRSRNFIDKLSEAEIARTNQEAGPAQFRKVSFGQRMYDRVSALFSARAQLHRYCNPVAAYQARLQATIAMGRDSARAASRLRSMESGQPPVINTIDIEYEFRENGKNITSADHLRAQIALKEGLKILKSKEKEIKLSGLDQYLEHLEDDFRTVKDDYERWQKTLQRPAYFEKVNFRFSAERERDADSADESAGKSSSLERWITNIVRWTKRNFAVAIVPFEAYYAYAAFSLITPKDHKLALTASIIFAVALGVLGSMAGNFFLRAWRHRIGTAGIERIIHKRNAALLALTSLVALALVVGGADLRSKIPAAQQWQQRADDLNAQEIAALSEPSEGEAVTDGRSDPVAGITDDIDKHDQKRAELLRFDPRIESSDEIIAYGIYLSVFLAAFGAWVFGRDPYNEYSLCAEALANLRSLRARAATLRDQIEYQAQEERSSQDRAILDFRSRLWLLDRNDPIALSPYDKEIDRQANADAGEQPKEAGAEQSDPLDLRSDKSTMADHWLFDRVARFARWYVWFGGKPKDGSKALSSFLERERAA